MKTNNHSNALLVELLIVIMFFMLAATVLLQVFATARVQSDRAHLIARTLNAAQSTADVLCSADDAEAALKSMGYSEKDGIWALQTEDATFCVSIEPEPMSNGVYYHQTLSVIAGDGDELMALPCSRYREVTP